jgi:phenylalanyl-tRNA synthetase beta chain
MATLEINKKEFTELVGEEFEDSKLLQEASFLGAHWHSIDRNSCEVETYPNRPDLLSVEGLARAYRGFFDLDTGREKYRVEDGELELEVDESVEDVRPEIGAAVVRDIELSERVIDGLIQLQEKLHETMGRRRDKLAIGLHDLSTVDAPFTYRAVEPEKVSFKPLEYDRTMQLGDILDEHEKGQKYAWILEGEEKYPVIKDAEGKILSFPPIINNQLTEVSSGTTDLLVEVTGKDRSTVLKALNIVVTALGERGGRIESVKVQGEALPDLSPEKTELDPEYFRDVSGLDLTKDEIVERLEMMKFGARKDGESIAVEVPCYRNDVMHQYDLIEDIVIAHRYTNIEPEMPEVDRIGKQQEIEDLASVVRDVMTAAGALEALTYVHENRENLEEKLEVKKDFVEVENPLSQEYSALRNLMTPSLLEVLKQNKHRSYPQKFFETGEVAELDDSPTGASNRKKLVYVESGEEVDFTDARETLQVLERDLGTYFSVEKSSRPFLKDQRAAEIYMKGESIGFIGEISQEVREDWELDKPVACFEIDLEKIDNNLRN